MAEVAVKTHLIIKDIHEEYDIKWFGSLANITPELKNGLPIFVVSGSLGRVELNTVNIKRIEERAKDMTKPRGREAITADKAFIFIKLLNGEEKLIGSVTHRRVKTFAPMYDKVGYK